MRRIGSAVEIGGFVGIGGCVGNGSSNGNVGGGDVVEARGRAPLRASTPEWVSASCLNRRENG